MSTLVELEDDCRKLARRYRMAAWMCVVAAFAGAAVAILLGTVVNDGKITCWGLIAWLLTGMLYGDRRRWCLQMAERAEEGAALVALMRPVPRNGNSSRA